MTSRVPLSILELAPVSQGSDGAQALKNATALAQNGERLGYRRFWVAEHHGSEVFMASATSVILAHLACHTSSIRLGSGGVMLPNHAPLMVAEHYGTLALLYGDRIDLGLGRAPGTDPVTAAALRRGTGELDTFAQDVVDLAAYLGDPDPGRRMRVRAFPGQGTKVPLWMLGSSLGGASVAAYLGLPFCFASHFAPEALVPALQHYRAHFNADAPTAQIERPYVMAGINVVCAPTDDEAQLLATTGKAMATRIRSGRIAPLDPPNPDLVSALPASLSSEVEQNQRIRAVGTKEGVVERMEAFVAEHDLDELIIATFTWDPKMRRRSFELVAKEWGLSPRS